MINAEAVYDRKTWAMGKLRIVIIVDKNKTTKTKQDRISKVDQRVGRLGSVAKCKSKEYEIIRRI